jgi:hypothetical protein
MYQINALNASSWLARLSMFIEQVRIRGLNVQPEVVQGPITRTTCNTEVGVGGWYGAAEAANNTIPRCRSFYTNFQYKAGAYGAGTGTNTGTDTGSSVLLY